MVVDTDERGMTGVGVMILFIAFVIVAAIVSGLIFNTADHLQETAEPESDSPVAESDSAPASSEPAQETTLIDIEIDSQAAWLLTILTTVILIGRSSKVWTGIDRTREWVAQRREESTGEVDEIHEQYIDGDICEVTLEDELEDAMNQPDD